MDEQHPTPIESQLGNRLEQLVDLSALLKIEFEPQKIVNFIRQAMQCVCDLYLWSTVDVHWLQLHAHVSAGEEADKDFPSHLDLFSRILQARQQPILDQIGGRAACIVALSNGPSIFGCLVCSEISTVESKDPQWLQIVANCVSLAAEKHRRAFLPQEKLKEEFLRALVTKAFPCTVELQAANLKGFSPGLPHIVMRMEAHDRMSWSKVVSPQELLKVVESVSVVRTCSSRLLIPDNPGTSAVLTCLVSQGDLTEQDQRRAFLRDLYLAMQNALPQARIFIGISDVTGDYVRSIEEADAALQAEKRVNHAGGVLFYHEQSLSNENEESKASSLGYLERLEKLYHTSRRAFQVLCWYLITKKFTEVAKHLQTAEGTVRNDFKVVASLLPEVGDDTQTIALIDAVRVLATIRSLDGLPFDR
jgi:hypothetical protein